MYCLHRSRRQNGASTLSPFAARRSNEVHAQIGGNETVLVKWCSAHYYTFYVSVVPAKYQKVFFGSEASSEPALRQYANMLDVGSPRIITASSIHHPSSFITRLSSLVIIHHFPLPRRLPPPHSGLSRQRPP